MKLGQTRLTLQLLWLTIFCPVTGAIVTAGDEAVLAPGEVPRQLLAEGAGEGPAWDSELGLLFSGGGHTMQYDREKQTKIFRKNAGSNGLLFDQQGRLLTCEARRRRITRWQRDESITVLAERYDGHRFNQPNDLTVDSSGRIYFSDPRYGDRSGIEMVDANGEQVEGVYRIDVDGTVSRIITHQVDRPNGLLVTPDDRHLYIADNNNDDGGARKLWRFQLNPDGTVDGTSRCLIYDWGDGRGPDGMALDAKGRLYVAGGRSRPTPSETNEKPGGVYVFSAASKLLTVIPIGHDEVTNCAFGGDELRTLFITAGGTLWSVRTTECGVGKAGSGRRSGERSTRKE